jgi:hypothetical protein
MDRTLKVYAKTGHLFAEFFFRYDKPRQAGAGYIQYRRLYSDEEEDENKSVFALPEMQVYLDLRQFGSIAEIRAHDTGVVQKELGRDMTDPPATYRYEYEATPILQRYVAANNRGVIGIINILYSFIDNTKEVKFLSGTNPRYDHELSSNSLETNLGCILRIPVYTDRSITEINHNDLKKLDAWY